MTSQAMNSVEECDRNFHPEDGFSAAHLHRETLKMLPRIFQLLTGSHILKKKAGQGQFPSVEGHCFCSLLWMHGTQMSFHLAAVPVCVALEHVQE